MLQSGRRNLCNPTLARAIDLRAAALMIGQQDRLERRASVELRSAGRRLEGYCAVFGEATQVGNFLEEVAPAAFSRSLSAGRDLLLLSDHDPTKVLARTRAGTLRLAEDSRGLHFETSDLPATSAANDVLELIRSGNAGGCSFAFAIPAGGDRWQGRKRTLVEVDLREVSVVSAFPAYGGTSVNVRSAVPGRLAAAQRWLETCR